MKVIEFQGNCQGECTVPTPIQHDPILEPDVIPSPDVPLAILKRRFMKSNSLDDSKQLLARINSHLEVRDLMKNSMRKIVSFVTHSETATEQVLSTRQELTQHDCYEAAVEHYKTNCFNWHRPQAPESHVQMVGTILVEFILLVFVQVLHCLIGDLSLAKSCSECVEPVQDSLWL
ncbi:LGMN protein, partial [Polypterus senegalus]